MNVKITARQPEGVLVDLEGSEVKPGGKATLSLSREQFRALTNVLASHLWKTSEPHEPKPALPAIGKGRHP